ncbi:MAG: ABC transporter ATP-binding protein [Planctomycetaceae bacterium]|jgi:iron complex transport system ATP-binding protein|nr:ABC transporter ATP-binding protein [Planctomycetaceae bacterium]
MLVSVRNLTVKFNNNVLLDGVSFDVVKGEYLAIIGCNGAGKSSLLKCLDKIITDWTGEIFFDNIPLPKISHKQLARRIAYVQQASLNDFAFTVRQVVEMGRYPHLKPFVPISKLDSNIVNESMALMDVDKISHRNFDTLSGGEKQKVLLATALAQKPDILLLDEPTTYLDYKRQSEIGQLLRNLNQKLGKTIIEVTHDVNRAVMDATHVIALGNGKILFDGDPQYLMNTTHLRNIYNINFQFTNHPSLPLKLAIPGI